MKLREMVTEIAKSPEHELLIEYWKMVCEGYNLKNKDWQEINLLIFILDKKLEQVENDFLNKKMEEITLSCENGETIHFATTNNIVALLDSYFFLEEVEIKLPGYINWLIIKTQLDKIGKNIAPLN